MSVDLCLVRSAVRIFVDTFKFPKLTKESVDFAFDFSALFADGLTEVFEL